MCASYGLEIRGTGLETSDERLATEDLVEWMERNAGATIRPTGRTARNFNPIVTPDGVEESWWGLWVGGAPGKFSTINARSERLTQGLWKRPFAQGRVLVPASQYFEYRDEGGRRKQRYAFAMPDGRLFAFAGVAAPIQGEGLPRSSYAIVTRTPTPRAAEIHDRMPLILPADFYDAWLDPARAGDEALVAEALAVSEELSEELVITAA